MGNAITNPKRFFEKKIMHEQFGQEDPKFPSKRFTENQCTQISSNYDAVQSMVMRKTGKDGVLYGGANHSELAKIGTVLGQKTRICNQTGKWPN